MNTVLHPWRLARRRSIGQLVVHLIVLAAMLFAVGLHGARACTVSANAFAAADAMSDPCHRRAPTLDACVVHCETDSQATRAPLIDLPALAPALAVRVDTVAPIATIESLAATSNADQRAGPPLHILLQRFLR